MTAKEKANELVGKYVKFKLNGRFKFFGLEMSKICALIAVNEILNGFYSLRFGNALDDDLEYWEEVKKEIENL